MMKYNEWTTRPITKLTNLICTIRVNKLELSLKIRNSGGELIPIRILNKSNFNPIGNINQFHRPKIFPN